MNQTLVQKNTRSSFKPALLLIIVSIVFFSASLLTGCAGFTDKDGIGRFIGSGDTQKAEAASSGQKSDEKGKTVEKDQKDKKDTDAPEDKTESGVAVFDKDKEGIKIIAGTSPDERIQSRFDKSLEFYQTAMEFWQQGEIENALEALDNGYALIINTEAGDDPKFIQQKDDLRFMISKRILEIYASRHTTVKGNYNAIPIEINDYVQREIDHFTQSNARRFFINAYKRSGRYRPYIVEELQKAGLPEELSWLPLVESGYRVNALSHARALGMWQFIASTGYKFGLKRDAYVDERLDPYRSTQAAIAYLQELHNIFGDWKTVLAAYNCGEGRVLREIRRQNINYLDDFWDLYERLPRETAQYVPRFIATLHIVENLEKYGMDGIETDDPYEYETIEIARQVHLKDIAEAIGTTESDLARLNPELRYQLMPGDSYELRVPIGKKELLLAKIDDILEYEQRPQRVAQHRVRRGETLSGIALRYGTTVREITRFNNIYRDSYIVAGQVLKIPQAGDVAAMASRGSSGEKKIINHTVRRGDSLWLLANRYNTTTSRIQSLNNLNSVNLHIGQELKIPTSAGPDGLKTYHVRQGDSPYTIARQHNMSVNELLDINQLTRNCRIYPDQELYVK